MFDGIRMSVNTPGAELFGELDDFMAHVIATLDDDTKTSDEVSAKTWLTSNRWWWGNNPGTR